MQHDYFTASGLANWGALQNALMNATANAGPNTEQNALANAAVANNQTLGNANQAQQLQQQTALGNTQLQGLESQNALNTYQAKNAMDNGVQSTANNPLLKGAGAIQLQGWLDSQRAGAIQKAGIQQMLLAALQNRLNPMMPKDGMFSSPLPQNAYATTPYSHTGIIHSVNNGNIGKY